MNVATPLDAATVRPPPGSVSPLGLAAKPTVTLPPKDVAVLPEPSRAVTVTLNVCPAVSGDGGPVVKCRLCAAPGTTAKAADVSGVNPACVATRVYRAPALSRLNASNVATPPTAATLVVPPSVAPPLFSPSARLTESVAVDTRLPCASSTRTVGAGLMAAPAVMLAGGSTPKASRTGVVALTVNGALTADSVPLVARSV